MSNNNNNSNSLNNYIIYEGICERQTFKLYYAIYSYINIHLQTQT